MRSGCSMTASPLPRRPCDRVMEASLWHHRGEALAALGRPTEATAHWCRALEMYGDHEAGRVEEVEGLIRSAATAASTTALR